MPTDDAHVPTYRDLRERRDAPPGSSWGVFGEGDQLGSLHHNTASTVVEAARLIRTGRVFNLDLPINTFVPSIAGTRPATEHHMFSNNPNHRDDWLDSFYLQSTTQLDGLRHMRHPEFGFYGGVADEAIEADSPDLGIQLVAEKGVAARGVLLDAGRYFTDMGRPIDLSTNHRITPQDLDDIARHQGTELKDGDVVLMRLGWVPFFLALPIDERPKGRGRSGNPGLVQSEEMLEWIWDHRVTMIAADNSGLEATPVDPASGWFDEAEPPPERGPSHNGMLHRPLIALLGVLIGELFDLEALGESCAEDGVHEFFFTSKPLNLVGGVGSPANAMAIK
jgi:hypothetical protein